MVSIRFVAKGLRQPCIRYSRPIGRRIVSIRFVAKGLRQRRKRLWPTPRGRFYSLCREGSSSTAGGMNGIGEWRPVSIRFVAKGLRQRDRLRKTVLPRGFYSLCREGSSSTTHQLDHAVQAGRWFLFALSRRVFVNKSTFCEQAAELVSIRFVAKGLRQPASFNRYHAYYGFYSLCREGSSSTRGTRFAGRWLQVSIRFVAKGLRQL